MRRAARIVGLLLIVAGTGALAWALVVWQWQDPFTAALNELDQRELADDFDRALDERDPRRDPTVSLDRAAPAREAPTPAELLARAAADWRGATGRGDAVARLSIPSLGVEEIVVNGTDTESLKRGPGRYLGSAMPGEGELVYVAGHRTTYGAPFSDIDKLEQGDRVVLELPYATFEYEVSGHRIVTDDSLWVLRSRGYELLALQACHPRFFATHRYIAYATPVRVTPRGGNAVQAEAPS
jgi:sortase A